ERGAFLRAEMLGGKDQQQGAHPLAGSEQAVAHRLMQSGWRLLGGGGGTGKPLVDETRQAAGGFGRKFTAVPVAHLRQPLVACSRLSAGRRRSKQINSSEGNV